MHTRLILLLVICLLLAPAARAAGADRAAAAGTPAQWSATGQPAHGGGGEARGLWRWCELPGSKVSQGQALAGAQTDPAPSPAANGQAAPPHLPTSLGRPGRGALAPAAVTIGSTLRGLHVRWQI